MSKVETRKNEVRITTSEPSEMIGKFLSERLCRTWNENFVDEDSGEVVSIERNEIIFDKGTEIDNSNISQINFFLQSGEIKEVVVSNQRRLAYQVKNEAMYPFYSVIRIARKNKKIILHAASVEMAIEIIKDFSELTFSDGFKLIQVKEFDRCIILKDTLRRYELDGTVDLENTDFDLDEFVDEFEEGTVELKFYSINVNIKNDDAEYIQNFLVETTDTDKAMVVIKDYLFKHNAKNGYPTDLLDIRLETAKIVPCDNIIDKSFSMAYSAI